uniref:Adenylate cyclase n=1 Tax=Hyaloperonospora arabidopsidis (strain Emoy2) TaxID=559515 RepID=M4BTL7_HYAAE
MVEHAAPSEEAPRAARRRLSSGVLRKELDMRLTAYLPAVVRRHLERQDLHRPLAMPTTHRMRVVSMFADVSGFTSMTESLAARGPVGAEDLAKHLNSYFEQLLRLVASAGGDVFKFAGDAMLIFWPESKEDAMDSLLRRALQCALRIQSHLHAAELARGVVLSVKVGVGIGEATIAHLGGESDGATARIEYVAVGPALEQAFDAEHQAEAGDVICSSECWKRVSDCFDGAVVANPGCEREHGIAFYKITGVHKPVKICSRRPSFTRHEALLHERMKQYVSRAVWPYLDAHDEFWGSELRDVTVLFINLGFSEQDLAQMLGAKELQRLQDAFACVQKCVYDYEGTINKFLVDDKGSTVIAAFGLPPVTHENDPIRGILASLAICAALGNTDLKASVGITTGTALCGVVGHQGNRREYTVLGDVVNLSARLMQRAKSEGGGVITDASTKIYTQDVLHFEKRPEIMVKGKNESIKIHRPYPRMSILLDYHLTSAIQHSFRRSDVVSSDPAARISGRMGRANALSIVSRAAPIPNLMENMHRVQVRDAQRRLSLRADRQCLAAAELVQSKSYVEARTALMEKCSNLNSLEPGGAFVLEGEIGVGKTVLLRSALGSPEAGDYQVLVGTACPFAAKKPYAIWSELITRRAQELSGTYCKGGVCAKQPESHLSPDVVTPDSSNSAVQAPSRVDEMERRKCVAQFVRQKIREGAARNTTVVRHVPLLNAILDTDLNAYPDIDVSDEADDAQVDCSNHLHFGEPYETQSEGVETRDENEQQNGNGMRTGGLALAGSPDTISNLKDGEITSWFFGLLEKDLAREKGSGPSLVCAARGDTSARGCHADKREREWKPADMDISGVLLLCALYAMSRERATVFCLDSAMHVDEKSWALVAIIAKYFTNCLIVVGTRPPSLALGEHTESCSFRKQLLLLKQMESSTCASLDTFCSEDIEVLSRQILQVPAIPDNLLDILVSRSQGNPLFLHEIIAEMQEQQVIRVDEKKGVRRCELHVQEPWGDKSKAKFCFDCHASFLTTKKDKVKGKDIDMVFSEEAVRKTRQRCQCCGYVFCAECTPKACQAKLIGKSSEPVRHCRTCYTFASSRRPSGSSLSIGAAVAVIGDKRTRKKSRLRSIFQPGSSVGQAVTSATSPNSPAASKARTLMNRVAPHPPRTVKSVLTTMLDRLTVSQRMLMKTASAIGPVFDKETLRGTCPIEAHLSRFSQDLEDLEQLAMIRRIDPFIGGVPASSRPINGAILTNGRTSSSPNSHLKVKFEFSHGFMCGVIRDQMLRGQLDKLSTRVVDLREQQQKQLRHNFFSKANGSLFRPQQLVVPALGDNGDIWRAHTPTVHTGNSRSPVYSDGGRERLLVCCNSHTGNEINGSQQGVNTSDMGVVASSSSPKLSTTKVLHDSECEDDSSPIMSPSSTFSMSWFSSSSTLRALPTFMRLKSSYVVVKKHSSMFSHLKLKGLKNTRQWKSRYAVLQNARLLLQYEESDSIADISETAASLQAGISHGTSLSLKGAKVCACDPEVAGKANCFQVGVYEWMKKGKVFRDERRAFIIGVECADEVESWIYMIRFAIESLEN